MSVKKVVFEKYYYFVRILQQNGSTMQQTYFLSYMYYIWYSA